MRRIILILLCCLFVITCSDTKDIPEERLSIFEYDSANHFKYWTISPRDQNITIFDFQQETDSLVNRFLVKRNGKEVLLFDTGFGNTQRSDSYQSYVNLDEVVKKIIPLSVIEDYYKLQFEKISYQEYENNSFIVFSNNKETYWYFLNLDSLNPPQAISNFEKANDKLYHRMKGED